MMIKKAFILIFVIITISQAWLANFNQIYGNYNTFGRGSSYNYVNGNGNRVRGNFNKVNGNQNSVNGNRNNISGNNIVAHGNNIYAKTTGNAYVYAYTSS